MLLLGTMEGVVVVITTWKPFIPIRSPEQILANRSQVVEKLKRKTYAIFALEMD